MNPELRNWNPFKFLRRTSQESPASQSADSAGGKHEFLEWPELPRRFLNDPWRAMSDLFQEPFFNERDRWFGDFSPARFRPRIDVVDDGKALRITAELPGVSREDIQTSVEAGALVIRGEKKQDQRTEEDGCYRLERAHGAFMRRIPLPDGVDVEHIDARFDNGVLTLNLPKTETSASTVRNIDIQ
ncbi:heat shock protein Hsp20 [Caballeronia udeis]|uniref:Heat shock protein Hsp20 n=1 Tax=Caballeronia udeis TaxID=1232866 RepID=A0A158JJ06_9BURK|nr:Hsp20/alpha crystallin family protein [Caballeronia udeis]SAL68867.1 heat shock protein Hsp20 [Caballeronia udeis]